MCNIVSVSTLEAQNGYETVSVLPGCAGLGRGQGKEAVCLGGKPFQDEIRIPTIKKVDLLSREGPARPYLHGGPELDPIVSRESCAHHSSIPLFLMEGPK